MLRPSCIAASAALMFVAAAAADLGAQSCDSWQRLAPLPTTADLNAVAGGPPGLTAVGANGRLLFSPDPLSWQTVASPTIFELYDVAWSSDRAVAVGAGGSVITSTDGVEWQAADTPSTASLYGVAAGPQTWVAVGFGGAIISSADGLSWQNADSGTSASLKSVVWRGTEFLAVDSEGNTLSSSDGLDWQVHSLDAFDLYPYDLASDGRRVVMVGRSGSLLSEDGRQWIEIEDLQLHELRTVTWTGEDFLTVLDDRASLSSRDGLSWLWRPLAPWASAEVADVSAWGNLSVMVGQGGSIAFRRHDSEQPWVLASGPTTVPLEAVASRDGTTVAVGGDGGLEADSVILISTDGARFSRPIATSSGVRTVDVTAFEAGFVVVGNGTDWGGGPFATVISGDGDNWTSGRLIDGSGFPPSELNAVTAAAGRIVAVGDRSSIVSTDGGLTWTWSEFTELRNLTNAIASNGQVFVVGGDGDTSFISTDGLSWDVHPGSFGSGRVNAIAWGNDRFVAVGSADEVHTSPDGVTWTAAPAPTGFLNDITFTEEEFVAVAGGAVYSSADGVSWNLLAVHDEALLRGVSSDGDDLVVVGGLGYIARSTCSAGSGPDVDFTWFPEPVLSGQPVRFWDLTVSDTSERFWTFGDGSSSEEADPSHVYDRPGEYEVTLTDTAGAAAASKTVAVLQGPPVLARELYLPGVAHLGGVNQTVWRSDVEICYLGEGAANVELALLLRDQANLSPERSSLVLPGFGCTRLVDAVGSIFGVEAAGSLRISSDQVVLASGRTYNQTTNGSYGSFKTALSPEDAACCMEHRVLFHLSQSADPSSGFRTNLGFLNLEGTPIQLDIDLYGADSTFLGSLTVDLEAYEYTQLLQPLLDLAPGGVDDAFALIQSPRRYLAMASLVDNRSGDTASIPAVLRGY